MQFLKSLTLSRQMKRTSKLLCYDIAVLRMPLFKAGKIKPTFVAGTTKEPKPHSPPCGRFCKL
jgi:hypothetical protein